MISDALIQRETNSGGKSTNQKLSSKRSRDLMPTSIPQHSNGSTPPESPIPFEESGLKLLDLFSGIGGFSLAAHWLGIETTQFVEINPFCQAILKKNFGDIPIHENVKTFTPQTAQFQIVAGGSPCQDLSIAGKQKGIINGDRSSLWFEQLRVYKESGATFLIWENVEGAFRNGFREILRSLSESGYDAEWQVISAAALGAPHLRERIFLIAHPTGLQFSVEPSPWSDQIRSQVAIARSFGNWASTQPPIRLLDDGFSQELAEYYGLTKRTFWEVNDPPDRGIPHGFQNRMDRLSVLGNAIVPQCAAIPLMRVLYLNSLLEK